MLLSPVRSPCRLQKLFTTSTLADDPRSPFSPLQPGKVQRDDGTPVIVGTTKIGFWAELKEVKAVLFRREVLTL